MTAYNPITRTWLTGPAASALALEQTRSELAEIEREGAAFAHRVRMPVDLLPYYVDGLTKIESRLSREVGLPASSA